MNATANLSMPGLRVRFTIDNLGLIGQKEVVNNGDTGTVIGPGQEEGWIYVEPDAYPQTICPVYSEGMIEVLA